jgi:hypothetical protein
VEQIIEAVKRITSKVGRDDSHIQVTSLSAQVFEVRVPYVFYGRVVYQTVYVGCQGESFVATHQVPKIAVQLAA